MDNKLKQVLEFNKAFGVVTNDKPALISRDESYLKYDLMEEENIEYLYACKDKDLVEIADALADMQYILNGMIIAHGLQNKFQEIFDEVHRSNMSKLEDGKVLRREDGKVLKGKDYFKPNIKDILNK